LSLFQKIQSRINPQPVVTNAIPVFESPMNIKHEFVHFPTAYRIAILCYYTDADSQEIIGNYKKQLEKLGYDCEVLMYIDSKERDHNIYLQSFNWNDLDKKTMLPHSPRTDRVIQKKYDLLLNLFSTPCVQLLHISNHSQAKCRVGPFLSKIQDYSDILIPIKSEFDLHTLILDINSTLQLKPYDRKQV
jgi:hypothetical protein